MALLLKFCNAGTEQPAPEIRFHDEFETTRLIVFYDRAKGDSKHSSVVHTRGKDESVKPLSHPRCSFRSTNITR